MKCLAKARRGRAGEQAGRPCRRKGAALPTSLADIVQRLSHRSPRKGEGQETERDERGVEANCPRKGVEEGGEVYRE